MIGFFFQDTPSLKFARRVRKNWLRDVCNLEGKRPGDINIVFCSDSFLLDINRQFLGHDYYTDIITFDYCEGDTVTGELYISVDTVKENAKEFSPSFQRELDRVMVHGILHLLGFDDHTEEEIAIMRNKEDSCLELLDSYVKVL